MSNTNAQIGRINNEIVNIGEFVGYYYTLVGVGNAKIYNNNSVSFNNGDNSSYCYTSTSKDTNFSGSLNTSTESNIFIGISKDLTQSFPTPSSPSMKMIDYGVLIDTQVGSPSYIQIINGKITAVTVGYPGYFGTIDFNYVTQTGVLSFLINNVVFYTITLGTTLEDPFFMVVGSFYGGLAQMITWEGGSVYGGGGLTSQNLEQILAIGNSANNQNITNVNTLGVLSVGNTTGTLNLFCGSSNQPSVQLIEDGLKNPQLTANNGVNTGVYFDSYFNVPRGGIICNSVNNIPTTKQLQNGATSLLEFQFDNIYLSSFDAVISTFSFTLISPDPLGVTFSFYLTKNKNAVNTNESTLISTSSLLNGSPFLLSTTGFLNYQNLSNANDTSLYLNVLTSGTPNAGYNYTLSNFNFNSVIEGLQNLTGVNVPVVIV
jgi:hypothetical protein